MWPESSSSERTVHPGTEYGRSIARYRPRARPHARKSWISYLDHPMAPAIALGLFAAGAMMLWPRQARGDWRDEQGGAGRDHRRI